MSSFISMSKDQLKDIAEQYGADATGTKNEIVASLAEEGVKYSDWLATQPKKDEDEESEEQVKETVEGPVPVDEPDNQERDILVKMDRKNPRYDIQGFTFTLEHPFVIMSESKAQEIFDRQDGFRIATPKEAQEYYK